MKAATKELQKPYLKSQIPNGDDASSSGAGAVEVRWRKWPELRPRPGIEVALAAACQAKKRAPWRSIEAT